MKQFLAPYQDSLKQLAAKSGDLKGYPLKTTVRIALAASTAPHPTAERAGGAAQTAARSPMPARPPGGGRTPPPELQALPPAARLRTPQATAPASAA